MCIPDVRSKHDIISVVFTMQKSQFFGLFCAFVCCVSDNFQALIQYSDAIAAQTGKAVRHFSVVAVICKKNFSFAFHDLLLSCKSARCWFMGLWNLEYAESKFDLKCVLCDKHVIVYVLLVLLIFTCNFLYVISGL